MSDQKELLDKATELLKALLDYKKQSESNTDQVRLVDTFECKIYISEKFTDINMQEKYEEFQSICRQLDYEHRLQLIEYGESNNCKLEDLIGIFDYDWLILEDRQSPALYSFTEMILKN